jgi:hypothetical protein
MKSDIRELAERQRLERARALARRSQRDSSTQVGVVTGTGDRPTVSIQGGSSVTAINLGGVLRVGDILLVQSDGLNFWVRGAQHL